MRLKNEQIEAAVIRKIVMGRLSLDIRSRFVTAKRGRLIYRRTNECELYSGTYYTEGVYALVTAHITEYIGNHPDAGNLILRLELLESELSIEMYVHDPASKDDEAPAPNCFAFFGF